MSRPVNIVRYTSECDVEHIAGPLPYGDALVGLRALFSMASVTGADALAHDYDLLDAESGRFVSWVLPS